METLKVSCLRGALLLSLPVILFELYAFVLPAFSRRERQVALPAMAGIPVLFVGGVVFGYFTRRAERRQVPAELQHRRVRRPRAGAAVLQVRDPAAGGHGPAVSRSPSACWRSRASGSSRAHQLAHNRRYAVLAIAVLAMVLPGQDPVTMTFLMGTDVRPVRGALSCCPGCLIGVPAARRRRGRGGRLRRGVAASGASARHLRSGLVREPPPMLFDLRSGGRRRTVKIGLPRPRPAHVRGLRAASASARAACGGGIGRRHHRQRQRRRRRRRRRRAPRAARSSAAAGQDHRPRRPTRPPGPRSPARASASPRVGDNFDPATGDYTADGPPPAHRGRPPRGTSTSRSTRRSPTSASPARWPRPSPRSSSPPRPSRAQEMRDRDRADPADLRRTWPSSPTRPASSARATSPPPRPSTSPPRTSRRTSRPSSTSAKSQAAASQLQQASPDRRRPTGG